MKILTFLRSMDKELKREIESVTESSEPFGIRLKSSFLLQCNIRHFLYNRYSWEGSRQGGLEQNVWPYSPHRDKEMMMTRVRQQQNSVVYYTKKTSPLPRQRSHASENKLRDDPKERAKSSSRNLVSLTSVHVSAII